jgi:Flp pilus assembly protein TadD
LANDQDSPLDQLIKSENRAWRLRKRQLGLLVAVLAIVGGWLGFVSWRSATRRVVDRRDSLSIYQNTRPEVKYVGDSACVRCHAQSAETFRRHPMGRSLAPIGEDYANRGDAGTGQALFESQGLQYAIVHRDGKVFHQETRRDASGRIVAQCQAEVQYAIGSGQQGTGYLIERDGFLFQSPLTWYSGRQRWDLSPGFEAFNHHFDRPIQPNCLYCHANRVAPVTGPINQYRRPIFQGHAIGCERCHGPGELHVARPMNADGQGPTIVNPANLPPALRDDVCAQCHLAGQSRVVRVGRKNEDYRPGLPFERFWTVFVPPADRAENRFVGQVEQTRDSLCFRASQGRLGCISCHDPHHFPAPEEKVGYYRDRCLACHAERGCALPASQRLERSRNDDCAECHMPKATSRDIAHAATTNHRIPRYESASDRFPVRSEQAGPDRRELEVFHADRLDAVARAEVERDGGVALCRDGPAGARVALPLLEAALAARADDVTARECKGLALAGLHRYAEALTAFDQALAIEPNRESALVESARSALNLKRRQDAAARFQRAIAINPWRSDYHAELAAVHFQERDWTSAADCCRAALRLNASWVKVRKLLIQCELNRGRVEAARGELETVLGFDPPDRADLLRSFAVQSRSGTTVPSTGAQP